MNSKLRQDISPEWTAAGYFFRRLLDTAELQGLDATQLLGDAGLKSNLTVDLEMHHPVADLIHLAEFIEQKYSIRDIGILNSTNINPLAYGLFGLLISTAPTLQKGIAAIKQYNQILSKVGYTTHLINNGTMTMRWQPFSRTLSRHRYFIDSLLSTWIIGSRELCRSEISAVEVNLSYSKPVISDLFSVTYGDNVLFDQPYNSVTFELKDLQKPIYYGNEKIHKALCKQADQEMLKLKAYHSVSERTENHIKQQLSGGNATIEYIADLQHISVRTLQRDLTREGTSFKELLNNVRREQAAQYMMDADANVLDVALRLGYNRSTSFSTAFKNWFGVSPSEYSRSRIKL